ncbi:hypothetical protein N7524_011901 [Penicillium chrysogenum]|nr:hypothetical protein N7524_011901 [Penicillium chrysogenum]
MINNVTEPGSTREVAVGASQGGCAAGFGAIFEFAVTVLQQSDNTSAVVASQAVHTPKQKEINWMVYYN